ncbi:tetraprenyl-beta-curcumene synthase family protein [Virgibacillus sp. LDC-1]|uniref:tetraprenyl-beta-curcumene synthase family protein n=1 Tax=Virgibacillus sp. LDC-1 TaxID=3039856 RepID=UPI0024DE8453|nr:tetraprenyl-beta-curcumene synthase family protein [Virgibacillus sp. LDC-1]
MMNQVYRTLFPVVNHELAIWRKRAQQIPNKELRLQALASLNTKRFHCQGGAVYALLAGENWRQAIQFIVAYQTISDYLDNLCDRSTSLDPRDFRLLHEASKDALMPENSVRNYYAYRKDQDDGGYLASLVQTCQQVLENKAHYLFCRDELIQLQALYADLQVYKHVNIEERIPLLVMWYKKQQNKINDSLSWYEFAAATGSTLGIFCLVAYSLGMQLTPTLANQIYRSYFPFVQGLHILLDYYIDQHEDEEEADLNFCSFYDDIDHLHERLVYFVGQAKKHIQQLPDNTFHSMIIDGLVGLYLSDPKVEAIEGSPKMRKLLIKKAGRRARFFHWNTKAYYKWIG